MKVDANHLQSSFLLVRALHQQVVDEFIRYREAVKLDDLDKLRF